MSDLIRITGLWKSDNKGYLSGTIGNGRIFVFPNKNKTGENQPDYDLCIGPKQDKDATGAEVDDGNDVAF
jgi:hypothetical protein